MSAPHTTSHAAKAPVAASPTAPDAGALTPLEISQAMLEGEENPNTARAITPLERAASGARPDEGERSRWSQALHSPAAAWGGAALAGIGLVAALVYARRTPASRWEALKAKASALPVKSKKLPRMSMRAKPLSFRG